VKIRSHFLFLLVLLLVASTAYLHRVPGLFGDEGSEGDNVYSLLATKNIVVVGERSYVGPLIDYVRTPFVLLLGYQALSLRAVMLLFSLATFCLAFVVLRRLFGDRAAPVAAAMLFFSPTYLLYQRLGWAITLFPFFAFLLLYFLTDARMKLAYRSALAGLAAGLGLHNYILFLPTIAAITVPAFCWALFGRVAAWGDKRAWRERLRSLGTWWLALLGFWAGFGTQFAVLQLFAEDQGNPAEVLSLFGERAAALPDVLPLVLSGSTYVMRYTGQEFSALARYGVTFTLLLFVAVAMFFSPRRRMVWLSAAGLVLQLFFLTLIVDRFTLRYLVVFVLGVWMLAGVGLSVLTRGWRWAAPATALVLLLWTGTSTLLPYLRTGGSSERFSLGANTDTAVDFVDTRALVACVHDVGPVWSDNPHIYNRLLFLGRGDERIQLPPNKYEAHWLVDYRLPGQEPGVICEDLAHFRLTKRK
jgi:hypothetical protein